MATTQPQQPSINLASEPNGAANVATDGAGGISFIQNDGLYDPATLTIDGPGLFSVDYAAPKATAPVGLATAAAPAAAGTGFATVVPSTSGIVVVVRDASGTLVDLAANIVTVSLTLG